MSQSRCAIVGTNSFSERQAARKASVDGAGPYIKSPRPFGNVVALAAEYYQAIWPTIVTLLKRCGPSAVYRRIWSVVVNTVKSGTVRLWAHIGQKSLKAIKPSGTNGNASTAPVLIAFTRWIKAARPHIGPGVIFACSANAPFVSVSGVALLSGICDEASTALACTRSKMARADTFVSAAIAVTEPVSLPLGVEWSGNNKPSTETLPGEIDRWHATAV